MKRIFILVLLLSACSSGPDFRRTAAPAMKSWDSRGVVVGKRLREQWWKLFSSPEIDGLVKRAMSGNQDLEAARQSVAQAAQAVRIEEAAEMPQVGIGAATGRQKYGVALFGPSNFTIPPFTYYEVGPFASWSPDLSGGERRRIELAKAQQGYRTHQLDAAWVILTGNVVMEAIGISFEKEAQKIVSSIVLSDQKTLSLVEASCEEGASTRMEVLAASENLDEDKKRIPQIMDRISSSSHSLAILLGKTPDQMPAVPDFSRISLPARIPAGLPSELARMRPDILASEEDLHAASAAIGIADSRLYPSFTLSANLMQEALTPAGIFQSVASAWSLAAQIAAPVYDAGSIDAQRRQARHAYLASLARYRQTILTAFGEVEDALSAVSRDESEISILSG
ncbi:MAG: efflux transporter outer membrane subunit, partial [Burkholderiales bacterium]|nr:efflux transporter outer membrane subunit [Burkholderiales bacterium]